ncbi:SDR family oxidoreductase [Paraburkholderia sp. CNPSo 3274]|uniref:SDR family NAD(P)-dependent oxidoreductase n=1 Tax=Paraburkholderia sp. CNPSo 3274 TaxID=2940932 RepID=UPI0020B821F9|nr:SDR family oxidoreductase [Paraburkholderia sp. CNPSo 3274]MCP3705651.1 SDR family oxidoreductase [Paraburkholderia sp. CNPSo 3274]
MSTMHSNDKPVRFPGPEHPITIERHPSRIVVKAGGKVIADTREAHAARGERYAAVFDANVLGTLLAMKHELRVMSAQQRGSIVNVSSTMGLRGAAGMSLYAASKHAVEGLTKSAALEAAASGVRVNAVAPGPIDTEMLTRLTGSSERKAAMLSSVPLKRAGTPEEIAEAIVFVGSGKASYMTGEVLRVNGGRTA